MPVGHSQIRWWWPTSSADHRQKRDAEPPPLPAKAHANKTKRTRIDERRAMATGDRRATDSRRREAGTPTLAVCAPPQQSGFVHVSIGLTPASEIDLTSRR